MKFNDLEKYMYSLGVKNLADIARKLNTTPQAVSNWKARNQVPYHIVAKLEINNNHIKAQNLNENLVYPQNPIGSFDEKNISLYDIMLVLAKQLKVILFVPFVTIFITFTYVQFIQQPIFSSWSTVLLPENNTSDKAGLAGLASQFGVAIPTEAKTDLSSPTLLPEILQSRTFAERMLDQLFYTKKYDQRLSLLSILNNGQEIAEEAKEKIITRTLSSFSKMIDFDQDPNSSISRIRVKAFEPVFAKELTDVALIELEVLNRYYKSQSVKEKINFIDNRSSSIKIDLDKSEQKLKEFNERNRQVLSPALQLEQDRLTRDLDILKGMYLTLKQQFELAKIEEIQESSIFQILDKPQIPLGPSNKNLRLNIVLSGFIGIILGVIFGFMRGFVNSEDKDDRKKLRRVNSFVKKKTRDLLNDRRITGTTSLMLFIALPFYIQYSSQNPIYFGKYSLKFLIVILFYICLLILSSIFFISSFRKKSID